MSVCARTADDTTFSILDLYYLLFVAYILARSLVGNITTDPFNYFLPDLYCCETFQPMVVATNFVLLQANA